MNREYEAYLNSDEWKHKRALRIQISKCRCSACGSKKELQVHHLTYERIFKEEMGDLLPLCRKHHEAAESLISGGHILRSGDALFLATETIRLLISGLSPEKKPKKQRVPQSESHHDKWYQEFIKTPWRKGDMPIPIVDQPKRKKRLRTARWTPADFAEAGLEYPPRKGWLKKLENEIHEGRFELPKRLMKFR